MLDLLTSFDGRIRRGQYWMGIIVVVVAAIIVFAIITVLFGDGIFGRVLSLLISVAMLYPLWALGAKRLADRGQPPMPKLAIFIAPGLVLNIIDIFQIGYRPMQGFGGGAMMPGMPTIALGLISLAVGIWALIELGILKGDPEANAYGPPPA